MEHVYSKTGCFQDNPDGSRFRVILVWGWKGHTRSGRYVMVDHRKFCTEPNVEFRVQAHGKSLLVSQSQQACIDLCTISLPNYVMDTLKKVIRMVLHNRFD